MGAEFTTSHGYVEGSVPGGRLSGGVIGLEYPSHTATDNLIMAAVLAKGTTVIENCAREPEVADLCVFLRAMGARITGAGTSRIVVEGVESLEPAAHHVVSDRVVAATFLAAAAIAGGEVIVEDARIDHMTMLVGKFRQMGVEITQRPEGLCASSDGRVENVDIATLPYPGVATDYKPFLVTMLSVADGVGIVTENLFSGRFRYVDELRRMGADIRTEGHHAVVRGRRPPFRSAGAGHGPASRRRPGPGRARRRRGDRRRRRPPRGQGLRGFLGQAPLARGERGAR